MKHKNVHLILIAVTVALTNISCKKYLDKKPDKKLTVPSTVKDLQALLDNTNMMNMKGPTYDLASCDDHFIPPNTYRGMSVNQKKAYVWENFIYNYHNDWALIYDGIYYANVAIEGLEHVERTAINASQWDNIMGSALVYRSFGLLKAAWIFSKAYDKASANSDLGIAIKTDPDFDQPTGRSSVAETYAQIINDLMAAAPLLPATPVHVMRPSKQAAYGLLARTYLSMRIYDSSYKYANLALAIKSDLVNYNTIDQTTIFPFRSEPIPEVMFNMQVGLVIYQGGGQTRIDSNLYKLYSSNDLRKSIYFRLRTDGYQFKGTYVGDLGSMFLGIATDEMLLTRAETSVRLGKTTAGMEDLNTLLRKRYRVGTYVEQTASTADQALDIILTERRKELVYRGLRWMDIKRLNKEGHDIVLTRVVDGNTFTLMPNENRYALPLPADIILMTNMPQNPR